MSTKKPQQPTPQQPQQTQQSQQIPQTQQQPVAQQKHSQSQPTQQAHTPVPPPQHPQYHAAANYYAQYNYAAGYPPPTWPTQARPPQSAATAQSYTAQQQQQPAATAAANAALDTSDVATLNDALGSAGVDLRAEEENLRQSHSQTQAQGTQARGGPQQRSRAKKQGKKVVFNVEDLGGKMRAIAGRHGLQSATAAVPEDSLTYLALALRARLSQLIEGMVKAAAHREETDVMRPPGLYPDGTAMWTQIVRRDVAKQLALLERIEREEELAARRERKTRESYTPGGQPALPSLDDALAMDAEDEPKKKKKKPDGPGVTAKNMSEDTRKKLSNAVATQAAGLGTGKYAWMNAGNAAAAAPVKKTTTTTTTTTATTTATTTTSTSTTTATTAPATGSSWSKPFQSAKKKEEPVVEEDRRRAILLKDAIFVIERERGHGGGRGAARGWT